MSTAMAGEHDSGAFEWLLKTMCALHRIPFDAAVLRQQCPPPHDDAALLAAARQIGFRIRAAQAPAQVLLRHPSPVVARLDGRHAVVMRSDADRVWCLQHDSAEPQVLSAAEFERRYEGQCLFFQPQPTPPADEDAAAPAGFGFRWFVPELLKHRRVWREVLAASLVLQLLTLGSPLFTQVIIDKVVVHRTHSTLAALGVGMAVFLLFTALLSWLRQFLVLHTGNRVDAVLGAAVFRHTLRLPLPWFAQRATGVIAARFQGVEVIREFVASAAITLLLDIPFLLIGLAIMLWYSPALSAIVLGGLGLITVLSLAVAPVLRARLNDQFLLGARYQAFLTEHVAGIETVKSLQMEPLLERRWGEHLAAWLASGFGTRQIVNTHQVLCHAIEQAMNLLVLVVGAWLVMQAAPGAPAFTIGMLVAFQMFAARLSQPVLRLVGLWQQFQQARLAVLRLGDLMNAPAEPWRLVATRGAAGRGELVFDGVGFRHGDASPPLLQQVSFHWRPGRAVAITGASGCGKSTLARLLLGFHRPTQGTIRVDGVDVHHLAANELRGLFGVVPQETVLFSGTVFDNLLLANPYASFEQVQQACRMAEVHEVIEGLPKGYQTEIGERGAGLSGGQKQRIAIARALLKNPRVLVFDEATSALDAPTAEAFARTINALRGRVTLVFIAHALPKALVVDEVYEIHERQLRRAAAWEAAA